MSEGFREWLEATGAKIGDEVKIIVVPETYGSHWRRYLYATGRIWAISGPSKFNKVWVETGTPPSLPWPYWCLLVLPKEKGNGTVQ